MPDFSYGDYAYLNEIDEKPKSYHEIFIHNICPDITIMNPRTLWINNLLNM